MKCKRILCLLLSVILLLGTANITLASDQPTDENALYAMISCGIGSAEAYLREQLTQIHNDSGVGFGSDWAVITLLRGGKTVDSAILSAYYASLTETVKTWTPSVKPTNAAKAALGFTVSGKDISDIDGANLVNLISGNTGLSDGANELAYSLLALDAAKAEIPQDATWQKSDMIGALLGFQAENGGFGLVDATADTDMTAICIQALSPYRNDGTVATAIGKALVYLKDTISDDWDYADNPNTTAQVLLALSALAIDITNPENGFGESAHDNIVTALEKYRNPDGNGYLYGDSVNTIATYQIMQAYDAYRKAQKDGISYWDFSTAGQAYNDLDGTESPAPDGTAAEPIDVFVTIADGGEIVTDKTGAPVAQTKVTVSDIDRDGTLTVNEALYAAHEALYEGGAEASYSTFTGDCGLSLAKLWGRGTEGVAASAGYYRNHTGCYSLTDAVAEGDYITAFNYYDTSYYSDTYAYFGDDAITAKEGSTITLTLYALGYDEDWNQVPAPHPGASVSVLGNDGFEEVLTAADGKVQIKLDGTFHTGTYYIKAYKDDHSLVPAISKLTVTKKTAPVITPVAKNLSVTVKVMTHGSGCNNSFTYRNNAGQYNPLVSTRVSLEKNKTVFDALKAALESEGIDYTEAGGYVSEIGGYKEFDHGPRSGWMFTVDGVHQTTGCRETKLTKNSTVIWYYTDDYTKERGSDASREEPPKGNDKPDFGLRGKHADITYKEITNQGKTFADIINCKGKAEIEALAERGIINGKTAEIYDPYAQMTRAEFATIMVNALGLPEKDGVRFEDVKDGDWYAPYIKTAYHYGIINGVSEHLFNPEGKVTAEEAATMIMRAATLCGMQTDLDKAAASDILEKFEDCEAIADWSVSSVGFCVKEGILESTQQKIGPREKLTRDVIAVMIYKMLGKAMLI